MGFPDRGDVAETPAPEMPEAETLRAQLRATQAYVVDLKYEIGQARAAHDSFVRRVREVIGGRFVSAWLDRVDAETRGRA